jgi:hypothetical protein
MTKLKKDENLASLIWASKVSYVMGLINFWDSQNWTRFSFEKECEKEITWVVNYHELEMIHGQQVPSHSIFSSNLRCVSNMCFPNYIHWFVCMSILGFKVRIRKPS